MSIGGATEARFPLPAGWLDDDLDDFFKAIGLPQYNSGAGLIAASPLPAPAAPSPRPARVPSSDSKPDQKKAIIRVKILDFRKDPIPPLTQIAVYENIRAAIKEGLDYGRDKAKAFLAKKGYEIEDVEENNTTLSKWVSKKKQLIQAGKILHIKITAEEYRSLSDEIKGRYKLEVIGSRVNQFGKACLAKPSKDSRKKAKPGPV